MRVGRAPIRARPALFYFPPAHPSDCRTTPRHSALSPKLKRWIRWVSDCPSQPAFRFLCGRAPNLLSRERAFGLCLCCARSTHFWMMSLSLLAARTPIRSPGVMPHSSCPAIPPCSHLGWRGAARLCFWHRGFPAPIHPVSFIVSHSALSIGHGFGGIPAPGGFASSAFPVPPKKSSGTPRKIFRAPPEMQALSLGADPSRFQVPQLRGQKMEKQTRCT